MNRIAALIVVSFFAGVIGASNLSIPDVYWLVFRTEKFTSYGEFEPIFLMQIDATGRVTKQPQEILPSLRRVTGRIAIGEIAATKLILWMNGGQNRFSNRYFFYRATIDRRTLSTRDIQKTEQKAFRSRLLSLTHRSDRNLIIVGTDTSLQAVGLNASGGLNGSYWPLSPASLSNSRRYPDGAISDDGAALLLETEKELAFQHLNPDGIPVRKPTRIRHNSIRFGNANFDITDPLPNGTRVVAIWRSCISYSCYDAAALTVRSVDAVNGSPFGEPVRLASSRDVENPRVELWLEPQGHFLIYSRSYFKQGSHRFYNVLLFQALDATGHPSGLPMPILENAGVFDVMKDSFQ